ncbi:hypothetical protein HMPREF0063_12337 [Aeromicrobium marinum DSM 15272]|uniref:DUF4352 domain-containing protein n=2 Tax=Aeromicrobium marinum TaxID=219314 RepID=E2SD25_9ACTN|nr:hypothetical protein HMPREF0063_12337 [Aeromicrobium marinum DSM 15272]
MRTAAAAVSVALVTLLAACGGGDEEPEPRASVPAGFDLPAGVEITPGGTQLTEDEPATVVYQVGDGAASAVTVTVSAVRRGAIEDFRFFSLDEAALQSTPFYVDLTVVNEGPAGLGGVALPIFARDDKNVLLPPNEVVGQFAPCPNGTLPESFLPDSEATLCLVYLVAAGNALVSVDLQPGSSADAIRWSP